MHLRRLNPSSVIPSPGWIKTSAHRQGRGAMGPCRAFTVIELIFVLIIISITAMLAVPRYANFLAEQRATATANRIAIDLAMAQRRAKFSSAAQTVSYDSLNHTYTIVGMQDPNHPTNPYVITLTGEPYLAEVVSVDFGGDAIVVFDGYGVPDTSGSVVIRSGSQQKMIQLMAQTGRVVVSDYSGSPPEVLE